MSLPLLYCCICMLVVCLPIHYIVLGEQMLIEEQGKATLWLCKKAYLNWANMLQHNGSAEHCQLYIIQYTLVISSLLDFCGVCTVRTAQCRSATITQHFCCHCFAVYLEHIRCLIMCSICCLQFEF